jgi:hypothetical protein
MSRQRTRVHVASMEEQIALALAEAQAAGAANVALRNLAKANLVVAPNIAAGAVVLLMSALVAKASGRFHADVSVTYSGTAGNDIGFQCNTQTGVGPLVLADDTPVGLNSFVWNGVGGAGIVVVSGGGTISTQQAPDKVLGTGQTKDFMSWSGVVDNGGAPFALGSNVMFYLLMGGAANPITGITGSIALVELP